MNCYKLYSYAIELIELKGNAGTENKALLHTF